MGYRTQYGGELTISPPLTELEHDRLLRLLQADNPRTKDVFATIGVPTDEDYVVLGGLLKETGPDPLYCWSLEPDKLAAPGETVSRGYQVADVLTFLHAWLKANGHELAGELGWSGDQNEDTGTVYVDPVHGVEAVEDVHDNPGPSWWTPTVAQRLQYVIEDWRHEVANGDTQLGYTEWVEHQLESARSNPMGVASAENES